MQPSDSSLEANPHQPLSLIVRSVEAYRSWLGVIVIFETIALFLLCMVAWLASSSWVDGNGQGAFRGFRFAPWWAMLGSAVSLVLLVALTMFRRLFSKADTGEGSEPKGVRYGSKEFAFFLLAVAVLFCLWGWQLNQWYRAGWSPWVPQQVFSRLDWRYLRAVDQRLITVKREAREGRRFSTDGIELLSKSSTDLKASSATERPPPGVLIDDARNYVVDWDQESFAKATSSAGREEALELLALQIEPAMLSLRRGDELIQREKLRLMQGIMQTRQRQAEAKSRYEETTKRWVETDEKGEKDKLANEVVACEDELNAAIAGSQRTAGRLNWLNRFESDRLGLNKAIAWLSLPIVARGGSALVNVIWLAAIYLEIRLVSVIAYLFVWSKRGVVWQSQIDKRFLREAWWFVVSPVFWGLVLWGLTV